MTNEYNDPSKQVQRLAAAGISPAAAFGGSSGSIGQSIASPSNPTGAHTSVMPNMQLGSDVATIFDTFGKALSAYKKLPADERQAEYVQSMIRKAGMDAENAMQDASVKQIQGKLLSEFGARGEDAKIQLLIGQYAQSCAAADKLVADKDYSEALQGLAWAQKYLTESNVLKTDTERKLLQVDLNYRRQKVLSEINRNNAEAYEKWQNGAGQQFYNEINNAKKGQIDIIAQSEIDKLTSSAKASSQNAKMAKWLCEKAEKENDLYTARAYVEMAHMLIGDVIDGVGEFTKFGALKSIGEAKKREVDLKQQEIYGTKHVVTKDKKIMDSSSGNPYVEHHTYSRYE